jgi:ribosomal protein S18 acetylase RimI-like enzyme
MTEGLAQVSFTGVGRALVRDIEEASFRAWPALKTKHLGGWLPRSANGHTRRANSVNVLERDPDVSLSERIDLAEDHYAALGQPPIFRLTPLSEPELDDMLGARGYRQYDRTLTMLAKAPEQVVRDDAVVIEPCPTDTWFDGFCNNSPVGPENRRTLSEMLKLVKGNACYASIVESGQPVAFGMSVVEGGRAGFFEILVAPEHRGAGLGRRIMKTLVAWACQDMGAEEIWLQVVADNAPAIALYSSFGLQPIYAYHYRVSPSLEP